MGRMTTLKNVEIERKFLLDNIPSWIKANSHIRIEQAYLMVSPNKEIRLRKEGSKRILTIKNGKGLIREEFETELHKSEFDELWNSVRKNFSIVKTRYFIFENGKTIDVDVFSGPLLGLAVVEVEFNSKKEAEGFKLPYWFGKEVTFEEKYKDKNLWISINKTRGVRKNFSVDKSIIDIALRAFDSNKNPKH